MNIPLLFSILMLIASFIFLILCMMYRESNLRKEFNQETKRLKQIIDVSKMSILAAEARIVGLQAGIKARDNTIQDVWNIDIPKDCKDPVDYVNTLIKAWIERVDLTANKPHIGDQNNET